MNTSTIQGYGFMLKAINLSLSCACGANCIFCPSSRGQSIREKTMSFESAQKIIKEASSAEFKKQHQIRKISIGENGDALLNKDLIAILRSIKKMLPGVKVVLFTNFMHLTKEKSEILLKEGLVSLIRTNIDGADSDSYFKVKRTPYAPVMKNLLDFLDARKGSASKIPVHVSALTLNKYINAIYNNLGFLPVNLKDPGLLQTADDFPDIKEQARSFLDKKIDRLYACFSIIGWAEREQVDLNKIAYSQYSCTNLTRIESEAFIAPDGTWYACCLDADARLSLGNIKEQSLSQIYNSDKRKNLIKMLRRGEFRKIGGPCLTVNCCQWLNKSTLITHIYRLLFKNSLLTRFCYSHFYL